MIKTVFAFEKSVGGILFRKEGEDWKVLLLRYRSGQWDFPKGKQEKGESDEMTLRREMREETGITDLDIKPNFRKQVHYFYRAKGEEKEKRKREDRGTNIFKKVVYYLAVTKSKEVKIQFENIDFIWLSFKEALERITHKASKELLREAFKALQRAKS